MVDPVISPLASLAPSSLMIDIPTNVSASLFQSHLKSAQSAQEQPAQEQSAADHASDTDVTETVAAPEPRSSEDEITRPENDQTVEADSDNVTTANVDNNEPAPPPSQADALLALMGLQVAVVVNNAAADDVVIDDNTPKIETVSTTPFEASSLSTNRVSTAKAALFPTIVNKDDRSSTTQETVVATEDVLPGVNRDQVDESMAINTAVAACVAIKTDPKIVQDVEIATSQATVATTATSVATLETTVAVVPVVPVASLSPSHVPSFDGPHTDVLETVPVVEEAGVPIPGWVVPTLPATVVTVRAAEVYSSVNVPVGQPGWGSALGQQVSWMVGHDVSTASISVVPAGLGPVTIEVSVAADRKTVDVHFVAQFDMTRQAISSGIPELSEALSQSGLSLGQSSVSDQSTQSEEQSASQRQSEAKLKQLLGNTVADEVRSFVGNGENLVNAYA